MKRIFLLFTFMSFAMWGMSQTTIWSEDFSTGTQYSVTLGGEGENGTSDYFIRTDDNTGHNIGPSYSGNTGYFFAGQDIDDGGWTGSASPSELTWTGIDISGYINLEFDGKFASEATSKIDDNDYIHVQYRIDGGSWTNIIWFENDGTTYNTAFLEDTDFDGDGDGTQLSGTFTNYNKSLNSTGNSLDLRITVAANSGGEDFAIEDFEISGNLSSVTPTKLAITSVNPSSPEVSENFEVTVQAQDASGTPGNVDQDTEVQINKQSGTGTLSGTLTGTISNGANSVTISGLSYDVVETMEINASVNSGMSLSTSSNQSITFQEQTFEPSAGDLIITEIAGDGAQNGSDNGFMEVFNASSNTISLDNIEARYYNSNPGSPTQTEAFSGLVAPGESVVVTQNASNFNTEYSLSADFTGSNFYFNGGDDGIDIYHTTNGIIDQFNDNGLGQSPWTWSDNSVWERTNNGDGSTQSNWTEYSSGNGSPGNLLAVTWNGTTDTDWNTTGNWNEIIPGAFQNVTIPFDGQVIIALAETGSSYDITIESGASGTGSIIDNGTLTVNGTSTVQRYLTQGKYHYVSSPFSNETYAIFQSANNDQDDFFQYNTSENLWEDLNDDAAGTNLEIGRGYAVQYAGSGSVTKSLTGTLNTGTITYDVTSTGVGNNAGDNLVGNPYPSAFDATSFLGDADNSEIQGAVYLWDESEGAYDGQDYATINSGGTTVAGGSGVAPADAHIGSGQGFFVLADSDGNISFKNSMRSTNNDQFYKNKADIQRAWFNVENEQAGLNQIAFSFHNDATKGYDRLYDAIKLQGNSKLSFYSRISDDAFVIQSLPSLTESIIVPLGIYTSESGEFTISLANMENMEEAPITLEDRHTGMQVNLKEEPQYSFTITEPGTYDKRFVIHFKSAVGMDNEKDGDDISIYAFNRSIYVNPVSTTTGGTIGVYNVMGQLIMEEALNPAMINRMEIKDAGAYIVKVNTGEGVTTQKVIIQ
ncbi:MAG: T9SS type A sorting domain-containing protein [Bacteroidales bacterium]|nr:T9SS type A sorting domain-containing protein [Bacteroidales bacterium]